MLIHLFFNTLFATLLKTCISLITIKLFKAFILKDIYKLEKSGKITISDRKTMSVKNLLNKLIKLSTNSMIICDNSHLKIFEIELYTVSTPQILNMRIPVPIADFAKKIGQFAKHLRKLCKHLS